MSPQSLIRSAGSSRPRRVTCAALAPLLSAAVLVFIAAPARLPARAAQNRRPAMYVTVTDQEGAPVTGLTPADFTIREDGVAREVLTVERATAPIEITLLVDTSEAASAYVADMRQAVTAFLADMAKGNEIAVTTFGGRPQVLQGYTRSPELLNRAVGRLFAEQGSGAYLLEGLVSVARGIAKREPERAAIVAILAQAAPEFSNMPYETVVKALRDSGASFDAIMLQTGSSRVPPVASEQASAMHDRDMVLDQGTRATGGVNQLALSSMGLTPQLKTLAAQMRNEYLVVYGRPESLIPPEKIEVSVKKPGLTARGTPVKRRTQQP